MATRSLQAASFHLQAREKKASEDAEEDPDKRRGSEAVRLQPEVCLPVPPSTPENVLQRAEHESVVPAEEKTVNENRFQYSQAKDTMVKASATSRIWKLWEILKERFHYEPRQCLQKAVDEEEKGLHLEDEVNEEDPGKEPRPKED